MRSPVDAFKHSTVSLLSILWNRINFPPATTGALKPAPIVFFHNCLGLRSAFGEIVEVDVPFRCGPRNCGQSDVADVARIVVPAPISRYFVKEMHKTLHCCFSFADFFTRL